MRTPSRHQQLPLNHVSVPARKETYEAPNKYTQALWLKPGRWPGIRVRSPLIQVVVTDEDRDGVYVVYDTFSSVYGAGETVDAALEEYVDNLLFQFDELDRDEAHLGTGLKKELRSLREYFARES